MALFKCKMCGGSLEIVEGMTVTECEYCGTKQTLPKLNDDKRANLYDRANHFRRNNEFDKAMGIYENILNEDNTDAEAYWSLVLCRYGIEYVEDPTSHKRIPTVNRAQFTSIFDDDNYKSALQYADRYQRTVYEEEAKAINEIQKGILAISQKEDPFDVFICYKESDNNGRRTPDSVLAQDLYYQLKQEGFKVFFARITLENKLGSAYEPYIFAALNSAKVMVVLGTKPEFFNAVWVKNEWNRYLALIKQGQRKMLIPAYKDMDPYDLPEEFSHLQAQDMSKLGFMQDLIRGIKKIIKADAPTPTVVKETVVTNTTTNANIEPLLERAFLFLEDADFESADAYCEKVLDVDPKCAQAYLGKLMAELHIRKRDNLKDQAEPFDSSNNYQKAIRFADEKLKTVLIDYIDQINTRNENARLDSIYTSAKAAMSTADTESTYKEAAQLFESIREYKDSAALAMECYEKAEADRLEKERKEEIARQEAERKAKRNKKIVMITTPIVCAIIAFVIVLNAVIIPNGKYNDAIALMNDGKYTEAISAFRVLDGYKDSATKITECYVAIDDGKYNDAIALMNDGKYTEAISAFEALDGYKDSATKITECYIAIRDGKYNDAIDLMNDGKYTEAISAFETLEGYKDSANKIIECNTAILDNQYNDAIALMNTGDLDKAYRIFKELGNHRDAADKAVYIRLAKTKEQLNGIKAGNHITFGAYEQDNNTSNGKEDIEWLVLEVNDGRALLISKYALDCQPYNMEYTDVTWETCTLRKWLNNDFVNAAFSSNEKAMIPTVTVTNGKSNATQDQVFLLNATEANQYFSSDSARQCLATNYAIANGADVNSSNGNCWWWLRSTGFYQSRAEIVNCQGNVFGTGFGVTYDGNAARPVLWIDLNT